jgi:apolipoprotein D and lipocalin family protein|tara:strand:- start:17085 stop:17606 length:522 start_codon:yes stop_codon:yes gene_type:complete
MNTIFKSTLLLSILLLFTACSSKYAPLKTVKKVDINRYLGTWYEIARYEHFFEKGCKNVSANYTLRDDNKIKVVNLCQKIDTNEKTKATGVAYTTNESASKLKVSFFRPFYGNYWVLMLDEEYKYALIGEPSREYLWILSRTKKLDKETLNKILDSLPALGYTKDKLIWTIQE